LRRAPLVRIDPELLLDVLMLVDITLNEATPSSGASLLAIAG
jgi:hypothetical protein